MVALGREPRQIDYKVREIQALLANELWIIKLNINTRPDTQPMATVDAVTAKHDCRYFEGSQSKFSESHAIIIGTVGNFYGC